MKKIFSLFCLLAFVFIQSCEDNSTDVINDTDAVNLIPLAIGNTWNYTVTKEDIHVGNTRWEIVDKKDIPIIYPDSNEISQTVFVNRIIMENTREGEIDTVFGGFFADTDGVVLVNLNFPQDNAEYVYKVPNNAEIDWVDSINPVWRCVGTTGVTTEAGEFNCFEFQHIEEEMKLYASKNVGIIQMNGDGEYKVFLKSYTLK